MWSGKFEYQCQHGGDGGNQTGTPSWDTSGLLGYFTDSALILCASAMILAISASIFLNSVRFVSCSIMFIGFLSFLAVAAACRMAGCLPCMYVNTFRFYCKCFGRRLRMLGGGGAVPFGEFAPLLEAVAVGGQVVVQA
ncbi:hypothetical protein [Neisseria gonorrhoeae]|uniref:hypothetical protein n=1 Tax=Neisseria gonorrhoeae TaxID=485 RepID=UPI001E57A856|nr:hypothetical protein [Neisseria gonorrhoeae]MCC9010793.1 hypothetical protein [Neisseria gonorrhoeae]